MVPLKEVSDNHGKTKLTTLLGVIPMENETATTTITTITTTTTQAQHHQRHPQKTIPPFVVMNHPQEHEYPKPNTNSIRRPIEVDKLDELYEYDCSYNDCENDDGSRPKNEKETKAPQHRHNLNLHYHPNAYNHNRNNRRAQQHRTTAATVKHRRRNTDNTAVSTAKLLWSVTSTTAGMLFALQLVLHLFLRPNYAPNTAGTRTATNRILVSALVVSNVPLSTSYGGVRTPFSLSSSPTPNAESSSSATNHAHSHTTRPNYYIREAIYSDLNAVAHILIHSFYSTSSPLLRPYLHLSELSRLQGNFPYGGSVTPHRFYVAVAKPPFLPSSSSLSSSSSEKPNKNPFAQPKPTPKEEIIGFVDIDARPSNKPNTPPRPYLSDLAVKPSYRRCGVAKSLVQRCEEEVVNPSFRRVLLRCRAEVEVMDPPVGIDELYLRVERTNDGALGMYGSLGYDVVPHEYFGVRDTTLLLRRGLVDDTDHEDEKEGGTARMKITPTITTTTAIATSRATTATTASTMVMNTKAVTNDPKASTTAQNVFAEKYSDVNNVDKSAASGGGGDVTGTMTDRQTFYGAYCIDYVI